MLSDLLDDETLDELDQALASDMEECRPIYPNAYPVSYDAPVEVEPSRQEEPT